MKKILGIILAALLALGMFSALAETAGVTKCALVSYNGEYMS